MRAEDQGLLARTENEARDITRRAFTCVPSSPRSARARSSAFVGPALNKRPDKSLLRVERAGGRWRVTDAASFEVDERDHADRSFKAEVCRDFQLLDAFNVIGATFCLLRINPDNRELFVTAPAAAANA